MLRYKTDETDDGLSGKEGTFLICSFWLVSALAVVGETQRARDLMEKLLRVGSPLGLYAEEFDADTARHLGNFPQAFSHLALIEAAARIIVADIVEEVQMVCLDDLVPADDELRRIEALVDWGHVRETARPFYRPGGAGRPGYRSGGAGQARVGAGVAGVCRRCARCSRRRRPTCQSGGFSGFGLTERLPGSLDVQSRADQALCGLVGVRAAVHGGAAAVHRAGLVGGRRLLRGRARISRPTPP